tara:strand:- start:1597 stop:2151 length:555 start_codon:yes stop_codon:yes gene_type:complete
MKVYILLALLVLVILLTRREPFTEIFGLSGYSKPVDYVRLNDPRPNLSGYKEVEASVNHDMMETFTIQANAEISKRIGTPTYIIETAKIKKHTGRENDIYECVFMVMKKGGFSYGFSVVASFEVKGDTMKLVSLRTQPIDIEQPGNVKAFTDGAPGKEFLKFELVKEAATPTMGEFEEAKNKLM